MRDHGLAGDQRGRGFLDRCLHFAVERRTSPRRAPGSARLQDHACDRDALALPARELHATLADLRVIAAPALPILQVEDEDSCACASFAARSISASSVRAAVANVVADRAMQQRSVLRHHRDLRAQALLRNVRVDPARRSGCARLRGRRRSSRLTSVDFPAPERPTSPTFSPGFTVSVSPSITKCSTRPLGIDTRLAPVAEPCTSSNAISPRVTASRGAPAGRST